MAAACLLGLGLLLVGPGRPALTSGAPLARTTAHRRFPQGAGLRRGHQRPRPAVDAARRPGPVSRGRQDVKAEVVVGPNTLPLELKPRFRQPGAYNAEFVPTRPGGYIFRFSGHRRGSARERDVRVGPGPLQRRGGRGPLQFPDKVPSGVELQRALAAADSRADTATLIGGLGLLAGVVGAALAAWALASRRRLPAPRPRPCRRARRPRSRKSDSNRTARPADRPRTSPRAAPPRIAVAVGVNPLGDHTYASIHARGRGSTHGAAARRGLDARRRGARQLRPSDPRRPTASWRRHRTRSRRGFTEAPAQARFSELQVFDSKRDRVDRGETIMPVAGDPRALTIALPDLAPGTYTVVWKTLSAVDGHVARGPLP